MIGRPGESGEAERVLWQAYPSWRHFTWLYLFSLLAAWRGVLAWRFALAGSGLWFAGAAVLLGCVVVLRGWARYRLTDRRILVLNGYTGEEIASAELRAVREISVQQGLLASWLGIGTVIITADTDRRVWLRGVLEPEVIRVRIEAARPIMAPGS